MGKRKGIWLGKDDLWLEAEAEKRGVKFSDFAKVAMRRYVGNGDGLEETIAELVVQKLAERGLVVRSIGVVEGEDVADILGDAAGQFL